MDPHITFSGGFAEWEACHGANLDLWKWEHGIYSIPFKARVLAWWKYHNLVRLHSDDAVERVRERKTQKGKKFRRRP